MEKKKKSNSIWIIGIFAVIFICSIFINELMYRLAYIDFETFKTELSSGNDSLVVLTKNDCKKCNDMLSTLIKVKKNGITVYAINIDELSSKDMKELIKTSSLIDKDTMPSVLHISGGSIIGNYKDKANYNDIVSFYETYKYISVSQFEDMLAEDKEYLIYVGRPTCHYCVASQPLTKRIAYELNLTIYHINIDEETSNDLQKLATLTSGVYKGSTPLFMRVKNGKVVNYKEGADTYANLKSFFDGSKTE